MSQFTLIQGLFSSVVGPGSKGVGDKVGGERRKFLVMIIVNHNFNGEP
jgi:hypothetical protein